MINSMGWPSYQVQPGFRLFSMTDVTHIWHLSINLKTHCRNYNKTFFYMPFNMGNILLLSKILGIY